MIIWVDDFESIEVELCAQASYADKQDLAKMERRQRNHRVKLAWIERAENRKNADF